MVTDGVNLGMEIRHKKNVSIFHLSKIYIAMK